MMVRVESSEQVEMTTGGVVVLEVRSGSARAQARPDQPLVIGRERGCQLVVDDPLVSRRHAEVVFAEDGWLLRDLGSRNGTFVEGQRSAYVAVTDGGEFRLPEIMAASGAKLIEVGTTNRTRGNDYRRAITPKTALILKVHPSNYRVVGFTNVVP